MSRAAELVDGGEAAITLEDVLSDWQQPGFDPALDVLLVFDRETLVGAAEVPGWRVSGTVHPEYRGRGIGTALLGWIERRALKRTPRDQEVRVGQTVPDANRRAAALFALHGYERGHTSWVLRLPHDRTVEHPPLPAALEIRPYRAGDEDHAVYRIVEDAFGEWPDRQPTSYERWQAIVTGRADFDPSLLLVAVEDGEIVGTAFGIPYPDEGWVQNLAVRKDRRGLGVGKALLRGLFEEFRRRDFPEVGLNTDSRTGALDLYLRAGMVVRSTYTHYFKRLRTAR